MNFDLETFEITNIKQAEVFLKWLTSKGMTMFNKDGIPMDHRWIKDGDRIRMAKMLFKEVVGIAKQNETDGKPK